MPDDRQWGNYTGRAADVAFRLIVMQKIAPDLKMLFGTEPQLPHRLKTLRRTLTNNRNEIEDLHSWWALCLP